MSAIDSIARQYLPDLLHEFDTYESIIAAYCGNTGHEFELDKVCVGFKALLHASIYSAGKTYHTETPSLVEVQAALCRFLDANHRDRLLNIFAKRLMPESTADELRERNKAAEEEEDIERGEEK